MANSSTSPPYDLIVFDWDGTLFDSTRIIVRCIQDAVRDVGGTVPDDRSAAYVIGMNLAQALAHAAPDVPQERYGLLGERYRHHYFARRHDLCLFDGVLALLAQLKARQRLLAVATGMSRRSLDQALGTAELAALFDASRTADETEGKPHPRMLLELMQVCGVPASRTLMIGDTSHDLHMALNAGCASVGVAYGAHEYDGLQGLGARTIAHSVRDLHDWLMGHV